jgi:hypothetical protein
MCSGRGILPILSTCVGREIKKGYWPRNKKTKPQNQAQKSIGSNLKTQHKKCALAQKATQF